MSARRLSALIPLTFLLAIPAFAQMPPATELPPDVTPVAHEAAEAAQLKHLAERFAHLKFTGYVQGRYEHRDDSAYKGPGVTEQFLLRRGRLKAVYAGKQAEYLLQIDASGKGVVLKDAEATFIEPWTGLGLRLTAGQFKWPFGYETLQSSGEREMPERSLVIQKLFPGERDRGARLKFEWRALRFAAAVVNGNGTDDKVFPGVDNTVYKDVVGRVGLDLKWVAAGASFYKGRNFTGFDAAKPGSGVYADKNRYGGDAQVYLDVPGLGQLAVKGEFIAGQEAGHDVRGWTAMVRQNLPKGLGLFVRTDQYDPDTAKGDDQTLTLGGGAQYLPSANVKLTAAFEHPQSKAKDGSDPADDRLTLQIQGMF